MQRKIIKAISAALVFVTLLSVSLVSASAKGRDPFGAISTGLDEDGRKYKWLSSVTNKNVWSYTRPVVTVGGKDSSVNGIIIGEKGKAKVQTFSAGGWNIQCFHYRTRVDRVK